MDEIDKERRKTREILNNNYKLRPYNCGGPGGKCATRTRKHVWTFPGAYDDISGNINPYSSCRINTTYTPAYQAPSCVGEGYFCDTGAHTLIKQNDYDRVYMDDPLWDGEGCSGSSTCCSFKNPPWFCKNLTYHTTDDLELRLCSFFSIIN